MAYGRDRVFGRRMIAAAVVGLAMVASGCSMTSSLRGTGLPKGLQAVGGGFMIDWDAPVAGTVYLVETTSNKVIETRSLDEGESYDFSIDSEEGAAALEKAAGIRFAEARLVLYFKPANP